VMILCLSITVFITIKQKRFQIWNFYKKPVAFATVF
jgi:hypothetical protein